MTKVSKSTVSSLHKIISQLNHVMPGQLESKRDCQPASKHTFAFWRSLFYPLRILVAFLQVRVKLLRIQSSMASFRQMPGHRIVTFDKVAQIILDRGFFPRQRANVCHQSSGSHESSIDNMISPSTKLEAKVSLRRKCQTRQMRSHCPSCSCFLSCALMVSICFLAIVLGCWKVCRG